MVLNSNLTLNDASDEVHEGSKAVGKKSPAAAAAVASVAAASSPAAAELAVASGGTASSPSAPASGSLLDDLID